MGIKSGMMIALKITADRIAEVGECKFMKSNVFNHGSVAANSAILSAIIFNALIIIALIPLALRGVKYTPIGALATLQRNLLIYGLGGIVIPFIGIKLIDILLNALGLV